VPAPAGVTGLDLADRRSRARAADLFAGAFRPTDAALLRDRSRAVVLVAGTVIDPNAPVFDPGRDREDRFAAMRAGRKTKVSPSQRCRRKPVPARVPGDKYTPHAFATAVQRACRAAGVLPWHPNQLRHVFATAVRREYGLEAVQVVLGHCRADVTQVYAERDEGLAVRIAAEVG